MSSVFNQPEVTSPDSMSRFFLDSWLAKNGSHSKTADTLSVDLMCGLQRVMGQHRFTSLDLNQDENQLDLDSSAEEREVDQFSYPTPVAQKAVAAIALEALDRMIEVFGPSNPALKDIRDALLPSIYVSLAQPPTVTEDELTERTDIPSIMLSTDQSTTEMSSSESKIPLPPLSSSSSESTEQEFSDKHVLSGKPYMHCLTWRDNVEKVLSSVKPTEDKLKEQLLQNIELTSALLSTTSEVSSLKKSAGDLEDMLFSAREENSVLTRDKEEVQCNADRMSSELENSRKDNNQLTALKEAASADFTERYTQALWTITELEETLRVKELEMDNSSTESRSALEDRDAQIISLERRIVDLRFIAAALT
jgi:hypothetical protein